MQFRYFTEAKMAISCYSVALLYLATIDTGLHALGARSFKRRFKSFGFFWLKGLHQLVEDSTGLVYSLLCSDEQGKNLMG